MTDYEKGYNHAIIDVLILIKGIYTADSMIDELDEVRFYDKIYDEILGLRGNKE